MIVKRFSPKAAIKSFNINTKYKDRLFRRLFRDKKDLLELYNAVNHTNYTNPDDLEITTLDDVIYLSMRNDLSFIISLTLNLYEHQSTFNPNMPIRGFMYFARLYETYIKENDLNIYGSAAIKLPRPQFVVFYNGQKEEPDEMILKLSDMFEPVKSENGYVAGPQEFSDMIEPVLECRARMLNINYGHNKELLEKCRRLHDYAFFIATINNYLKDGHTLNSAVNMAVDTCIKGNILTDILLENKSEVISMLLTEYDEKELLRLTYRDGRIKGRNEGRNEGLIEGRNAGLIEGRIEGRNAGLIEGRIEERENSIIKLIRTYKAFYISKEEASLKLMSEYSLTPEQADDYIDKFW